MLITTSKTFDTILNVATTSGSVTVFLKGIVLLAIPITTGIACGLTISSKVIFELVSQRYNKYKIQYQKDQQTIKCFNNLNSKI